LWDGPLSCGGAAEGIGTHCIGIWLREELQFSPHNAHKPDVFPSLESPAGLVFIPPLLQRSTDEGQSASWRHWSGRAALWGLVDVLDSAAAHLL